MTILGTLRSGEIVKDRLQSFLRKDVKPFLAEALAKIDAIDRYYIHLKIDMGREIGHSICVETTESDEIIFAQRTNRKGITRFVKNRNPIPSSTIVVILKRAQGEEGEDDFYIMTTAYIGNTAPHEPWDAKATEDSLPFWSTHALIFEESIPDIVPGTETIAMPADWTGVPI